MAKKKGMDMLLAILALAGGLNWVLVGAFQWDLVQAISFGMDGLARIIYVAAGAAGAWIAGKMLM